MAPSLTQPQGHLSPAEAMHLAQQAPTLLRGNPKAVSSSPLLSLFSATESADLWAIYENLLLSCLRTGNDEAAAECLSRLVGRFGANNERIMALKGLFREASAQDDEALRKILKEYDDILKEDEANIPIAKRRVALLRSMGKIQEAITALTTLVDFTPIDSEGWAELADLYLSQGLYAQAIHALEEVLVLVPNAWNMQARLGEVCLMAATATATTESPARYLAESVKRFCRSVELCDDYLRGYYGLKKVTDQLLSEPGKSKKQTDSDLFTLPEPTTVEKLNQLATERLAEIVRRNTAGEALWQGYDAAEIAAARALIEKSTPQVVR